MKNKIRFIFALLMARVSIFALKVSKRNGTHFPGHLALKLFPSFLAYLPHPKSLIAITGTNGKTTSSNIIIDVMKQSNLKIANNAYGSNIQEGIITTLIKASSFFGQKTSVDLVILEVDERVSPKIYPFIQPDVLLMTNLFRDSYRRNANIEFIADILEDSIPAKTHLIVNADEVVSSYICKENTKTAFSIQKLENERSIEDSLIQDVVYCPNCDQKLNFAFKRYHHFGHVYCPNCGFTNLEAEYQLIKVDDQVHIQHLDRVYLFDKLGENITDHYNLLAAITTLSYYGLSLEEIQRRLKQVEIAKTRFDSTEVNGKRVIVMMAKDQNPVAVSRVFDYIATQDSRNCAVIFINENSDHHTGSENTAYYYDTDFEYLNQPHIVQIISGGHRHLDFKLRALMAGIEESRVYGCLNEWDTQKYVRWDFVEDVYILYGTKTETEAYGLKKILLESLELKS